MRNRLLPVLLAALMLSATITGCKEEADPPGPSSPAGPNWGGSTPDPTPSPTPIPTPTPSTTVSRVDPRFELVALIFRLAGDEYYVGAGTDYQRTLDTTFAPYSDHQAVQYAASLSVSGSKVARYSFYILPDFSGMAELGRLISFGSGWTREMVTEFFPLVTEFYVDSGFESFFESNHDYYLEVTSVFESDPRVASLDIDWLVPYAEYQKVETKFDYILSPSLAQASCAVRYEDTNYAVVATILNSLQNTIPAELLVHELIHSFGDGFGIRWFMEDQAFATLIEDTEALSIYSDYDDITISAEYIVRAYTIKYFVEHDDPEAAEWSREVSRSFGYTHIDEVYAMIQERWVPGHDL